MAEYVLTFTRRDGEGRPMFFVVDFDGDDLKAEEYLLSRKAVHLYRDMMYSIGKWPPKAA